MSGLIKGHKIVPENVWIESVASKELKLGKRMKALLNGDPANGR
jgi:hypothetical protein